MTQIEVLEDYGQRLATKADELTHQLNPNESASVALFETAYLLIYLTLRPLREHWKLVGTDQTTQTLDKAQYWLLREVVCAVLGVSSDPAELTDPQRDEVDRFTTDHEMAFSVRNQTYDRAPFPAETQLLKKFLEYIQTRIGQSFDDQDLSALLAAYMKAFGALDPNHFVNQLLELR